MKYLTLAEAAKAVGCSEKSLRRAISAGSLRAYFPGGMRICRIRPDDLAAWVEDTPIEMLPPTPASDDPLGDLFEGGDGIGYDEDSPEAALVPKRR